MDTKQPLSLFLVAILVASVVSVAGLMGMPLKTASAVTTIETSADEHGEAFFQGMLQVIIEDDTTDEDGDTIDVDITVELDGGDSDSGTVTIDDTNDGSQRFEFFLVHEDAPVTTPDDPENDVTTEIFEFGDGAADFDVTGFTEFESGSIEIEYDGQTVTIDYDESDSVLTLDRTTPYGSTSIVRLTIEDNDGNLDPTSSDSFDVTAANLDASASALFEAVGVDFVDTVTFTEEGDNDALFEAELQLATTASTTDDELIFSSDAPTLTLNDKAVYSPINSTANDSTATSDVSFEIEDDDGTMAPIPSLTFGSEIQISITDDDQNEDSEDDDTIVEGLTITVQGSAGSDFVEVDLAETGDNTGIFVPDLTNDEVKITFLNDTATFTPGADDVLQLRSQDIEESILVTYTDPLSDAGGLDDVASRTIDINLTPGSLSAPETAGVNDEFTVTLTEPDLNDNRLTRDSYVIEMTGASPFDLTRGGDTFSEIYQFEMTLAGDDLDFGAVDESVTMTETTANSGIFEFDIDMEAIGDSGNGGAAFEISDGDDLDINILDFMADTGDADENEVTITIGKPTVDIDFSRTSVPIPPPSDGETFDEVGSSSILTLLLTDPQLANDVNEEETEDFDFGTVANNFTIEVDGEAIVDSEDDFFGTDDACSTGTEAEIVDGVSLCEVMGIEEPDDLVGVLEETAEDSGLFEWEMTFTDTAAMALSDWDDLDIEFTYSDDEGDEHTAGFTFRGSDGSLSVDQPTAKAGTIVTITVEDQDMNLDDAEIEHFDVGDVDLAGPLAEIVLLETEDEEISDLPDIDTFDETGDDTGIFTTSFEVGVDVPISELVDDEVEQATNILITYNDEIDSTGGAGDEIEVSVPIVSSTGSIQVSPDLVGPATTMTILVVDSDLDEDADAVDDYEAPDSAVNSDDFFISFASDRNEVGEGSPDIEETGANTGVFMFTLELLTDEVGCQDDDLDNPDEGDADDFDAEGGDTDATIGACPGDLISIRYEDQLTGGGGSATVSEVVEVSSFDPEFVADQDTYAVGDKITITISDPDANRDAEIADSLPDIRVRSDSDQVGEELSAVETGEDTGVFRLSFGTTSGTASGAISVKTGDDVTITYTDEFPADFEEQEEDKDFDFAVAIGTNGTDRSTTVTAPAPTDSAGRALDEVNVGQQIVLTTNVINQNTESQPFVALVEVRDSADATVYLAWQTGTLNPSGQAQVGLSWTPAFAGDYNARTFVISSLNNPTILSTIAESDITVS